MNAMSDEEFTEISGAELSKVLSSLPSAAPGLDGVTMAMLKVLNKECQEYLLDVYNYLL